MHVHNRKRSITTDDEVEWLMYEYETSELAYAGEASWRLAIVVDHDFVLLVCQRDRRWNEILYTRGSFRISQISICLGFRFDSIT